MNLFLWKFILMDSGKAIDSWEILEIYSCGYLENKIIYSFLFLEDALIWILRKSKNSLALISGSWIFTSFGKLDTFLRNSRNIGYLFHFRKGRILNIDSGYPFKIGKFIQIGNCSFCLFVFFQIKTTRGWLWQATHSDLSWRNLHQ